MEISTTWLTISQVCTAIGMLLVAWQQYQLRRQEFRHALYDKRLQVFKEVKRYLSKAVSRNQYDPEEGFWDAMAQSEFIFDGSEINKYLHEIYSNMMKLQCLDQEISDRSVLDEERGRKLQEKRTSLFDWMVCELKDHPGRFKKYLAVRE